MEYVHIFGIQLLLFLFKFVIIELKIYKIKILASLVMVGEQGQPIATKECHEVAGEVILKANIILLAYF